MKPTMNMALATANLFVAID